MPLVPKMEDPEVAKLWLYIIRTKRELQDEVPWWRKDRKNDQKDVGEKD